MLLLEILTTVIFTFTLTFHGFVYALTFISSSAQKPITLGVATDLVRRRDLLLGRNHGSCIDRQHPRDNRLQLLLDRFIAGITGGAVK